MNWSEKSPQQPGRGAWGRRGWELEAVVLLLALLIFMVDLWLPLGVAGGIPYAGVVFVSFLSRHRRFSLHTAALCSALVVAGFFLSPPGGVLWQVISNRILAMLAIWVIGLLGFWHRKAEDRLRETNARVRSIVETGVEGIITINAGGVIETFNPAAERLFGYRAEEVVGEKVNILMPAPYRERHDDYIRHYLETGEARIIGIGREVEALRRDGSRFPIFLSVSEMRLGNRRMFTGFISDMTERNKAEAEVRRLNLDLEQRVKERTRELEALNRELEAFTYSVSHDLRAPLRAIDGFSQAVLEDYRDRLDAEGADHLQRVRAASRRMGRLIDDLLTLSRMTRAPMARKRVDLSALARSVAAELQQQDPGRDVEVVVGEDLTGLGDPQLLRIVLENLLGNAWKFTSRRQEARIEFGAAPVEGQPAFFVRDNGAGFDMTYYDKLFSPFQRLHSGEEFAGTGIGLATVQRIINRHDGKVWAEGREAEGAVFYFTLGPEP